MTARYDWFFTELFSLAVYRTQTTDDPNREIFLTVMKSGNASEIVERCD